MSQKKILVTGGCGYIGGGLIRKLIDQGYYVKCLDLLIYGNDAIKGILNNKNFSLIVGDVRDKKKLDECLKDIDEVVHLAGIVGDKPCEAAPKASYDINYNATKTICELAQKNKVKKFIFASTCSNYGIAAYDEFAKESTPFNPVSLYAEAKIDSENYINSISNENFKTFCLRFATAYGVSYRTRFDLTVNSFAYEAYKDKKISVFAADTWRPYIHVNDINNIIIATIEKDNLNDDHYIFNAGFTKENFTKRQIVEKLINLLPDLKVDYIPISNDKRNYKVDFSKIEKFLGIKNEFNVSVGFKEVLDALKSKKIDDRTFYNSNLDSLIEFFKKNSKRLEY
jgi:nucleoside-diphosphate-sugar epimerase